MKTSENCGSVLVGMSGGVDSSVAALQLKNKGFSITGVTLKLWCDENSSTERNDGYFKDAEDAKSVCERLKAEHTVFDFTDIFKECVIDKFVNEYKNGNTPNPCIECNKLVKFGAMLSKAESLGYDFIATGHYARISQNNGRFLLSRPKDVLKDQTYVLYVLSQNQLSKTLFPLGDLTKAQVREIARENGFVNSDRKDSQDICFVPDGKYYEFINRYTGKKATPGKYIDLNGKIIGENLGFECYTVGQRKGLGMGFGKPMYVISKNSKENTVTLGEETELFSKTVLVKDVNFIVSDKLNAPLKCKGKLRYRQKEEDCILHQLDETTLLAEFDKPQRAITPGQAAVFYDGEYVVAGGTICGEKM